MPYCPKCKYEYNEDTAQCSDCGSDLVERLSEDEVKGEWLDLVCIRTYPYDPPAEVARAVLETRGIRARLENAVMSQADQFLVFADGGVRLMVAREDVEKANAVLEEK